MSTLDYVTRTGFDQASTVKPGTVIERVYFSVPGAYTPTVDGVEYDTYAGALEAALAVVEHRGPDLPQSFCIDTRWVMKQPSGSNDVVAERTRYSTPEAGREHLTRIHKFTPEMQS